MTDSRPAIPEQPLTEASLIVEAEMRIDPIALKAFYRERGIKCFLCPVAEIESFAEGARLHKFDVVEHLAALNALAQTKPFRGEPPGLVGRLFGWIGGAKRA